MGKNAKAQRQEGTWGFQDCEETGIAGAENTRQEVSKGESKEVNTSQVIKESGLNCQSSAGDLQNRLAL